MTKNYYMEAEREALCKEYLSGKQTRKGFCAENNISTKSLSRWLSRAALKAKGSKFIPVGKLTARNDVLAEILLPNGMGIKLHLSVSEVPNLIKGLVL